MEFKKCLRCGSFFMSNNNVCCNCEPKDKLDISKLNNFMDINSDFTSIEQLSMNTGISSNNLSRFLNNNNVSNPNLDIDLK